MSQETIKLEWIPGRFAVCRLDPSEAIPTWAQGGGPLLSITRSENELSIVADQELVPVEIKSERNWAAMRVQGKLDFALIGILAKLTSALAEAKISCLAISTFDTDYILVKEDKAQAAEEALGNVARFI
ncbi:MAG: ACT domain-containing protein [Planctomycetes bacterium]|nr:ACT domain-containing protein [Planctomycetota bacterium]